MSQNQNDPKLVTPEDLEKESLDVPSLDKDNLILEDSGFRLVVHGDGRAKSRRDPD